MPRIFNWRKSRSRKCGFALPHPRDSTSDGELPALSSSGNNFALRDLENRPAALSAIPLSAERNGEG